MDQPVAIGIDVGGTKLVAATLTAQGRILERVRRATPAGDANELVDALRALLADLGGTLPVGVGIAGLVTPAGLVRYGPNIGVRDLDLAAGLATGRDQPVVVVNDGSAAALGEQRAGAGTGRDDVVLLTLGTGVGGGVVVGGRLLVGAQGFGGELGHVIVEDGGRPCPCGNLGCLEAYAAGTALGRRAAGRLEAESRDSLLRGEGAPTGKAVAVAAGEGDALAREVIEEAGRWLGIALGGLVNALDPEVVLLGGGAAAETAPWLLPEARAAMGERIIGRDWRTPPPIELAGLGDDAGMVGAGLLAAQRAAG